MIAKNMRKEKHLLRAQMRELLRHQSKNDVQEHCRVIESLTEWQLARTILIYSPLPGEPDPTSPISAESSKEFYFPRIEGEHLSIYRHGPDSRWVIGPFGLREPDPATWDQGTIAQIDLALVPGLAFDKTGGRLGRGGGFYDRLLGDPAFQGIKIGLCWKAQLLPTIPCEQHDIVMDYVITG